MIHHVSNVKSEINKKKASKNHWYNIEDKNYDKMLPPFLSNLNGGILTLYASPTQERNARSPATRSRYAEISVRRYIK